MNWASLDQYAKRLFEDHDVICNLSPTSRYLLLETMLQACNEEDRSTLIERYQSKQDHLRILAHLVKQDTIDMHYSNLLETVSSIEEVSEK
jgi:hypothetical protein